MNIEKQQEKEIKEASKSFYEMKDKIVSLAIEPGYTELISWWKREEQGLDANLSTLKGQELEVAVQVRIRIKKFLSFLENITK